MASIRCGITRRVPATVATGRWAETVRHTPMFRRAAGVTGASWGRIWPCLRATAKPTATDRDVLTSLPRTRPARRSAKRDRPGTGRRRRPRRASAGRVRRRRRRSPRRRADGRRPKPAATPPRPRRRRPPRARSRRPRRPRPGAKPKAAASPRAKARRANGRTGRAPAAHARDGPDRRPRPPRAASAPDRCRRPATRPSDAAARHARPVRASSRPPSRPPARSRRSARRSGARPSARRSRACRGRSPGASSIAPTGCPHPDLGRVRDRFRRRSWGRLPRVCRTSGCPRAEGGGTTADPCVGSAGANRIRLRRPVAPLVRREPVSSPRRPPNEDHEDHPSVHRAARLRRSLRCARRCAPRRGRPGPAASGIARRRPAARSPARSRASAARCPRSRPGGTVQIQRLDPAAGLGRRGADASPAPAGRSSPAGDRRSSAASPSAPSPPGSEVQAAATAPRRRRR